MKRIAALLLAAALLTACSGGSDSSTSSSTGADSAVGKAAPAAAAPKAALGVAAGGAMAGGKTAADASVPVGRGGSVVRTGDLEVAVADVARAADAAGRLARGLGGAVEADERASDGRQTTASLRLRVPPAAFEQLTGRVAQLGVERGRSLDSQDVTEQTVDLDSRVASQRASVDRVRALLSRATTLGQVVQVEAELTRRTADLESLEARRGALAAQVELSSLTVRLTEQRDTRRAAAAGPLGFGDGLRGGWDTLLAVGRAAAVAVGALLPFAPLLLLVALAARWRLLRSRRTAGSTAA